MKATTYSQFFDVPVALKISLSFLSLSSSSPFSVYGVRERGAFSVRIASLDAPSSVFARGA